MKPAQLTVSNDTLHKDGPVELELVDPETGRTLFQVHITHEHLLRALMGRGSMPCSVKIFAGMSPVEVSKRRQNLERRIHILETDGHDFGLVPREQAELDHAKELLAALPLPEAP